MVARPVVGRARKRRLVRLPEEDLEIGVPRVPPERPLKLDGCRRPPGEVGSDGRSDDAAGEPEGQSERQHGDQEPATARLEANQQEPV